jgi:hypothetical protein
MTGADFGGDGGEANRKLIDRHVADRPGQLFEYP